MSRTVVRESFARLAAQGLIVLRRGSGAYVADDARHRAFRVTASEVADRKDIFALLELRVGSAAEMAELAAIRHTPAQSAAAHAALVAIKEAGHCNYAAAADAALHAAIGEATGNTYFVGFTDFLRVRPAPLKDALSER